MIIMIECLILCGLFTLMVLFMSKDPIRTLYNYPPKIQERVKKLDEYKDKIPTNKNKIFDLRVLKSLNRSPIRENLHEYLHIHNYYFQLEYFLS